MTLPEARRTFANLMAKSRGAGLTEPDRRRLAQARQLLRRAKRPAMNPRLHWTENQRWREHKSGEIVTAEELLKRYGTYLRIHRISLIDRPKDFSVRMDDGTVWSRTTDLRQNPIELGYRSRKTGRGRHVSIGLERSQRSNPRRRVTRLGRALEVRYKREIGGQPGYYKHAIKSKRAGVYAIPPGWVYVGTKSVLITEKEPHV